MQVLDKLHFKPRALLAALVCAVGAWTMTPGTAHAAMTDAEYSASMAAAYKTAATASTASAAAAALDAASASDPNCQSISDAAENAAKDAVKAAKPPDPSDIIAATTCYPEVASIQIPLSGIGWLDSIVTTLNSFIGGSGDCNQASSFWADLTNKIDTGSYDSLMNQDFSRVIENVIRTFAYDTANPNGGDASGLITTGGGSNSWMQTATGNQQWNTALGGGAVYLSLASGYGQAAFDRSSGVVYLSPSATLTALPAGSYQNGATYPTGDGYYQARLPNGDLVVVGSRDGRVYAVSAGYSYTETQAYCQYFWNYCSSGDSGN